MTEKETQRRVGIYVRVSDDRKGEELAITRQEKTCRAIATKNKWKVVEVYRDNDISASQTKKARKSYQQLLSDLQSGTIDTILVYAMDRLYRRPIELEHLVEIIEKLPSIQIHSATGSDLDLATPDGVTQARFMVLMAKREIDMLRRRVTDKHKELALAGKPHGGMRAFGYKEDQVTLEPTEAKIIKKMVKMFLATHSTNAVTKWLQDQGYKTARGGEWNRKGVNDILRNPRIAGFRYHRGAKYKAVWPAIIDEATHDLINSILSNPERRTSPGSKPKYLLSGLVYCGGCGYRMSNMTRGKALNSSNTYACRSDKAMKMKGCGHVRILGQWVDEFVTEMVLEKLKKDKKLLRGLGENTGSGFSAEYNETLRELEEVNVRMSQAQSMWTEGLIEQDALVKMLKTLNEKKKVLKAHLDKLEASRPAIKIANSEDLVESWNERTIDERRTLLKIIIEEIRIYPASVPGRNKFDADRIQVTFKE